MAKFDAEFGVTPDDDDTVASPKPSGKANKKNKTATPGAYSDADAFDTADAPPRDPSDNFGSGKAVSSGGRGAVSSGGGSFGIK